jgi:uncharacterized protein (TIGR03435 family)
VSQASVCRGNVRSQSLAACIFFAAHGLASQASAPPAPAQKPSAQLPTFDVVSIKTHKDEGMMMRIGISATPDGFQADGAPLNMLIRQAFGLSDDRILNEPDWAKSSRFDIAAKVIPEDAPKLKLLNPQERFAMILPVLEDRFGLKFHHETKDLQVYALMVAKSGSKLKESAPADSGADSPPPPGASGTPGGAGSSGPGPGGGNPPRGPRTLMRMSQQGMTLDAHGSSMAYLSQLISQQIGATVIDKTGLTGKYDFTLMFMPDSMNMGPMMRPPGAGPEGGAESQEPVGPSLFTAVQEQLGLKLDAQKQPVDVIVIDQIEQPTAN